MSFISKILKESKSNYKQKFLRKIINNKTNISKKFLSLDGEKINFKFIKINNQEEINRYLKRSKFDNFRICYLMTWVQDFNSYDFIEQVDLVVCDLEWKVLNLYRSLPIGSKIKFNRNCHIYIMAHNSIEYNEISIGNYLRPF